MGSRQPDGPLLVLVYDARAAAPPPGVRAVRPAERHLLPAAEAYDVVVELSAIRRFGEGRR